MIRVGLFNLVDQQAADAYREFVGTHGTIAEREERASDWRSQNPTLWVSDEDAKAAQTPAPMPDPNAAAKARWSYRTTNDAPKPKFVPLIDSSPADAGYDHFDFEKVHPALRR